MRFVSSYDGSSWIFFDSIYIINDVGGKFQISNIYSWDKKTDIYSDGVSEKYDGNIDDSELLELAKVLESSNEIKVRLSGTKYKDYALKKCCVDGMLDTINYYLSLKYQNENPINK